MKIFRPPCEDGGFLAPQQYQPQAIWDAHLADTVARMGLAFSRLNAPRLTARFPDGTLLDTALSDNLPPVCDLSVPSERTSIDIVLALPLISTNGANPDDGRNRERSRCRKTQELAVHERSELAVLRHRLRARRKDAVSVSDWLRESNTMSRFMHLTDALWLDTRQAWYGRAVGTCFNTSQENIPSPLPVAMGFGLTGVAAQSGNYWQHPVTALTALPPWPVERSAALLLPDFLLTSLYRHRGLNGHHRRWRQARLMAGIFFLLASFMNNQRLVRSVGAIWRFIITPTSPLHRRHWHSSVSWPTVTCWMAGCVAARRCVTNRVFIRGLRLAPAVEAAHSDRAEPPPRPVIQKVVQGPKTVRLDSLSLFDSGKAVLKPDSTKVPVSALVGIRAKPGWLIVVSGHTDNIGHPKLNQVLSRERAESVPDWMRDTGDVPESCFAVQG